MWDLPRAGIEPVSLTLTGGFFTTEPPRKPTLFLNTTSLSWRIKKKSVKTGCFQGLIFTSHLSILPILFLPALLPSPFLLHSLLVNFSLLVTPGLSCPSACGILVPQPGIEPASSALQGGFLTTGPPGKSQHHFPLEALGFPLSATTPAQLIYLVDCLLPRGPAKSRPCKLTSRSHHRNSTPKRPWSKLTSQGFISIS